MLKIINISKNNSQNNCSIKKLNFANDEMIKKQQQQQNIRVVSLIA